MTAVVARSPLQALSMTSAQRPTRPRGSKRTFDDGLDRPAKRSKMGGGDTRDSVRLGRRGKGRGASSTARGGGDSGNGNDNDGNGNGNGTGNGKDDGNGNGDHGDDDGNDDAKPAVYSEDVDGFQFSRARSKRSKTPFADTGHSPSRAEAARSADADGRATIQRAVTESQPRRRSARLSTEKDDGQSAAAAAAQAVPGPRMPKKTKRGKQRQKTPLLQLQPQSRPPPPPQDRDLSPEPSTIHHEIRVERKRDATRIALPFADTPIIQRNKEMRRNSGQKHRRSSASMRGRRASFLIEENKSNAVPHAEVHVRDFYKHIEQDLMEPKRMKQLLVWCGSRALPAKPIGDVADASARMAARAIQEELLREFANDAKLSDVFSQEDATPVVLVRKPNPRNMQNAAKLVELERELSRLQKDKEGWEALERSVNNYQCPAPIESKHTSSASDARSTPHGLDIDRSLLSDAESALLATLLSHQPLTESATSTLPQRGDADGDGEGDGENGDHGQHHYPHHNKQQQPHYRQQQQRQQGQDQDRPKHQPVAPGDLAAVVSDRIRATTAALEPAIDMFAANVHVLSQYHGAAERVADHALRSASRILQDREQRIRQESGTDGSGTRELLTALGAVLVQPGASSDGAVKDARRDGRRR